MLTFRKYLCWLFAFIAFVCLRLAVGPMMQIAAHAHGPQKSGLFYLSAIMLLLGAVFGIAWWTGLRSSPSARIWGLIASSINFLAPIYPLATFHGHAPMGLKFVIGVGALGILAFAQRNPAKAGEASSRDHLTIPGDFTNRSINRFAETFIFAASLAAYLWWNNWSHKMQIPLIHSTWARIGITLVLLLILTTIHEFGHAFAGVACGMKLRAFFIGPFQWKVRSGKWVFHFAPKGIFLAEGVTGIVPATATLPRSSYLTMIAAGPLANILTGSLALFVSFTIPSSWSLQTSGMIALFGAWSLALAAGNLLPFRTRSGYSDGALILQLVSAGPFADFHMAVAAIGASLVSPVRPRDYDLRALRRAARAIPHGRQALLLRLYEFQHLLDCGKMREAEQALREAAEIGNQATSEVPVEAHSTLVFGFAFVARDKAAARAWWNHLEAVNSTNASPDRLRAECALHWIEDNLDAADRAWQESYTLAKRLPKAGAYEFGRDCCRLLRHSLDEAAGAAA